MLKQRLSPAIIVVLVLIALLLISGVFYLLMHRSGPTDSEAPPIANDPYAGQIQGPPNQSNPEAGIAP